MTEEPLLPVSDISMYVGTMKNKWTRLALAVAVVVAAVVVRHEADVVPVTWMPAAMFAFYSICALGWLLMRWTMSWRN